MREIVRKFLSLFRSRFNKALLGKFIKCDKSARIFHSDKISFGRYIYIGPNCMINAQGGINFGDGVILAPEVVILSSNHNHKKGDLLPYDVFDENRPVNIGNGVWLGYRSMICPGVQVGDGAIVAMGAVVTSDVRAGHVVGGNPARLLSKRDCAVIKEMVAQEKYFHKAHWSGRLPRKRMIDN